MKRAALAQTQKLVLGITKNPGDEEGTCAEEGTVTHEGPLVKSVQPPDKIIGNPPASAQAIAEFEKPLHGDPGADGLDAQYAIEGDVSHVVAHIVTGGAGVPQAPAKQICPGAQQLEPQHCPVGQQAPLQLLWPDGQQMPLEPQDPGGQHMPPQPVNPAGQGTHEPFVHVPLGQAWEQAPQLPGSLLRLTHRLPHWENPVGQLIWQPLHGTSTSSQATVKQVLVQPVEELESGRQGPQCGLHVNEPPFPPPLSGRVVLGADMRTAELEASPH